MQTLFSLALSHSLIDSNINMHSLGSLTRPSRLSQSPGLLVTCSYYLARIALPSLSLCTAEQRERDRRTKWSLTLSICRRVHFFVRSSFSILDSKHMPTTFVKQRASTFKEPTTRPYLILRCLSNRFNRVECSNELSTLSESILWNISTRAPKRWKVRIKFLLLFNASQFVFCLLNNER